LSDNASDIAQRILEQARKKADAAEVLYDEEESAGVRFQDNQLKTVSGNSSSGVGLRVIHRGRLGFSCTNDPNGADQLVANDLSKYVNIIAQADIPAMQPVTSASVRIIDSRDKVLEIIKSIRELVVNAARNPQFLSSREREDLALH
jgi:predicted Zn-dependent protease